MGLKSVQLLDLMRREGVALPPGTRLISTSATRADKAGGAWVWRAVDAFGKPLNVGSPETMTSLCSAAKLRIQADEHGATVVTTEETPSCSPGSDLDVERV